MRTDDKDQAQQVRLSEGMRLIFDQDSSVTPRSSRTSSRSSLRDSSESSSDSSRSSSVSRNSRRRRPRHRSSDSSSSSSSRSRSRSVSRPLPRCHRTLYPSRCRHRHRSRSFSPSPNRSSRFACRRYSRSASRSSSRKRFYRRFKRSRSRSPSYSRRHGFIGRFRYRYSPSPRRSNRYYRSRSRSPDRSAIRLSQKDKLDLLNIARENAAKILGVEKVEVPESLRSIVQQEKKPEADGEERWKVDLLRKSAQDNRAADEENDTVTRTSPTRRPITFNINNAVAKPSSSPTSHRPESKVTSRANSVADRKPHGLWIPVKSVSPKKR